MNLIRHCTDIRLLIFYKEDSDEYDREVGISYWINNTQVKIIDLFVRVRLMNDQRKVGLIKKLEKDQAFGLHLYSSNDILIFHNES